MLPTFRCAAVSDFQVLLVILQTVGFEAARSLQKTVRDLQRTALTIVALVPNHPIWIILTNRTRVRSAGASTVSSA